MSRTRSHPGKPLDSFDGVTRQTEDNARLDAAYEILRRIGERRRAAASPSQEQPPEHRPLKKKFGRRAHHKRATQGSSTTAPTGRNTERKGDCYA